MDIESATPEDVPGERPVVSIVLSAVIATVVYLAIQLAIEGAIAVVETAAFVIVFTGVYVAFLYVREAMAEG